jgi:xanthine dehydrogenase accessory factor
MERIILIKGGGDIATATAVRLHQAGRRVVVAETSAAPILRRAMSFGAAIDQGEVVIEGIPSRPAGTAPESTRLLDERIVPVWTEGWKGALDALQPEVLVDARMMKRDRNSETRRDHAPLVIGLGPGFVAGEDVHLVIETNHGPSLGRIIRDGEAEPHTGIARPIEGYGNERYTYAPADGVFLTSRDIGARVEADALLGRVGATELRSRFAGIVRGILKSGTEVRRGQRLVDVYPRGDETVTRTFTDRATRIADAVLLAIGQWEKDRG